MPDAQTLFDSERSADGDGCSRGFVFNAAVSLEDILGFYAPSIRPGEVGRQRVGDFMARALHSCPLAGDRVTLGPLEFVVLDAEGVQVRKVGMVLRPAAPSLHGAGRRLRRPRAGIGAAPRARHAAASPARTFQREAA
ncbi:MAG TPA: transporter associated domain-containing protein [Burkholderiales bacterium]|nr:transporter associated domain-containing protein [Burkholderiales bacterium]